MKSFSSLSSFQSSRGTSIIIRNDVERRTTEFKDLYPEIEIDGIKYKVKGVGYYARAILYAGDPIEILVDA